MGVEFLIQDKLSGELVFWEFTADNNHYIEVYIEGNLTDTLVELGTVDTYDELSTKAMKALSDWGIAWHSSARTARA